MRRSVLIAVVVLLFLSGPVVAGTVGPVKSSLSDGELALGIGYVHSRIDWENNDVSAKVTTEANLLFGEVVYGLGGGWATYGRLGGNFFDADNAFRLGADFEGEDIMPFVSVGLNGLFFDGNFLKVGPFLQASYFFLENKDTVTGQAMVDGSSFEAVKETVTFEKMWEAKVGFSFQMELEGAQFYTGPMYYYSETDYESEVVGQASGARVNASATLDDDGGLGWVTGVQWALIEGLTLDLEAQLRSDFDIGLVLKRSF